MHAWAGGLRPALIFLTSIARTVLNFVFDISKNRLKESSQDGGIRLWRRQILVYGTRWTQVCLWYSS